MQVLAQMFIVRTSPPSYPCLWWLVETPIFRPSGDPFSVASKDSKPLAKPFFHEKMDCFLSTPDSKTRNVEIWSTLDGLTATPSTAGSPSGTPPSNSVIPFLPLRRAEWKLSQNSTFFQRQVRRRSKKSANLHQKGLAKRIFLEKTRVFFHSGQ